MVGKQKMNNPIEIWAKNLNITFLQGNHQMSNSCVKRCSTSLISKEMQMEPL